MARDLDHPLLVDHIPDLLDRICEIVKAHGGELTVKSKVDDGATFAFTLPIAARDGGSC